METRQQKGMEIAQKGGISQNSKGWIVPSQTGSGAYLVYKENIKETKCTCPDFESRQIKCKHNWAVDYYLGIEKTIDQQGNQTITKTIKAVLDDRCGKTFKEKAKLSDFYGIPDKVIIGRKEIGNNTLTIKRRGDLLSSEIPLDYNVLEGSLDG